jgi:hypothetical protein
LRRSGGVRRLRYHRAMSFSLQIRRGGRASGRALAYNIRFMRSVMQALANADLLDDEAQPLPEPAWPPKDLRVTEARADELLMHAQTGERLKVAPSPAEARAIDAYRVVEERFRKGKPGRKGRVPSYKLESMDAWWVTAKEAGFLADGLKRLLDDEDDWELLCDILDFARAEGATFAKELRAFVAFCGRAAKAEGFIVS